MEDELGIKEVSKSEEHSTILNSSPASGDSIPPKQTEEVADLLNLSTDASPIEKEDKENKVPLKVEREAEQKDTFLTHETSAGSKESGIGDLLCHYLNVYLQVINLPPSVVDLIYWKDVRKSGIVLGSSLGLLFSLAYFSIISVLSTSLLLLLFASAIFRVYKYVLQAVHKSTEGHPYKDLLEFDLKLDPEEVKRLVDLGVPYVNSSLERLRSMFLIEDVVDSFKLAVVLWILTYIGSWFNGMTLIILADIVIFSVPKVYETYEAEIDAFTGLVLSQLKDGYAKVRAKIPIGNKKKEQ